MTSKRERLEERKRRIAKIRNKRNEDSKYNFHWQEKPTYEVWDLCFVHIWKTTCGLYRVVRMESRFGPSDIRYGSEKRSPDGYRWESLIPDDKRQGNYPKHFDTLEGVLIGVERLLGKKRSTPIISNRDKVVSKENSNLITKKEKVEKVQSGLPLLESKAHNTEPAYQRDMQPKQFPDKGRREMQITRERANDLLTSCGFVKVAKLSTKKVEEILNSLVSLVEAENFTKPTDKENANLLRKVLWSNKKQTEVKIGKEESPTEETPVDTSSNGHAKPKKGKKKATPKVEEVTEEVEESEEEEEPIVTTATAKKKTGSNATGVKRPRVQWYGNNAGSIFRWMGQEGWSYEEAQAVATKHGITGSETGIRTRLTEGRTGNYEHKWTVNLSRENERTLKRDRKEFLDGQKSPEEPVKTTPKKAKKAKAK